MGLPEDRSRKVTLFKPVEAYGEKVTEITLRPPTVRDLRECGQPYSVGAGATIKADMNACAQLLTKVCDPPLPSDTVDDLDPADFDDMAMILVGFTKRAPSTASASSSKSKPS